MEELALRAHDEKFGYEANEAKEFREQQHNVWEKKLYKDGQVEEIEDCKVSKKRISPNESGSFEEIEE
jgi:hypothetical protein